MVKDFRPILFALFASMVLVWCILEVFSGPKLVVRLLDSNPHSSEIAAVQRFTFPDKIFSIGETITTVLMLDTKGVSINAVSGNIAYDPEYVTAESVLISDSIISLWIDEPTLDSATSTIMFSGVVLSGFAKSSGEIMRVVFKTKRSGEAHVTITEGQVLANDGVGTNILSGVIPASFVVAKNPSKQIADINGDQKSDLADLSVLISHWGMDHPQSDLNGDGKVNLRDISIWVASYIR